MATAVLLALAGFIAGVIDSIAGGGGLITLPSLMLVLGAGPLAVGSNKIPGLLAAVSALVVYWRAGQLWIKTGLAFSAALFAGAWAGSLASPHLPREVFKILLLISVPLVLAVVFSRPLWMKRVEAHQDHSDVLTGSSLARLGLLGLAVGFYDGAWGPGGGTFMFLSLLFGAKIPLLPAIATAKLANSSSAGASLINYWRQSLVSPVEGVSVAMGSIVGAALGARMARHAAEKVVRPALVVISVLLLVRVFSNS
jgi:uncharacterized membrane protein YfcA